MDDSEPTTGGPLHSARQIIDSVLGIFQARLELASVELEQEKLRLLELLLRTAVLVVLGILTLVTATATIVVLFWETSPVGVLCVVTAIYAAASLGAALGLRRQLKQAPPPFAETLAEFKRDRECLLGRK